MTITAAIAIAILAAFAFLKDTRPVQAQDEPPPQHDRISFGMVGITAGQTMRITVSDTLTPNDTGWPPGPVRVAMVFYELNGRPARNRSGEIIRRVVQLERGDSTFLDIDFGDHPPPTGDRLQLRAVVTVQFPPGPTIPPPNPDRIGATVEVINNVNGRTQFVLTNPAVIRGFNPQPDPPLGQ